MIHDLKHIVGADAIEHAAGDTGADKGCQQHTPKACNMRIQEMLQGYLDAAQKEADFADDNVQKTYEHYITRFDGYMESVNIAIIDVGSKQNSLALTKVRVENQQTTIEELKSNNEDRDISDIIIDYYASYNAYTSSLTAAGKLNESNLLQYI